MKNSSVLMNKPNWISEAPYKNTTLFSKPTIVLVQLILLSGEIFQKEFSIISIQLQLTDAEFFYGNL